MPYDLIVDGVKRNLGDRRYLLSPQDLAAVEEIPDLLECGVTSFKIEGRLKTPEYVAAVTQVYRKALDVAMAGKRYQASAADRYQLEMTFSRGLYTGWLHGVQHQELVPARFGKKRGPLLGRVARSGADFVDLEKEASIVPGDGVVFDTGGDTNKEQGGRVFAVKGTRLSFQRGYLNSREIPTGTRVWKTDDPKLNARLRQSFSGTLAPRRTVDIRIRVTGTSGAPLCLTAIVGSIQVEIHSVIPLQAARTAPLTVDAMRHHLGRLGETGYALDSLDADLDAPLILPIGELNRLRREMVFQLDAARAVSRVENADGWLLLMEESLLPAPKEEDLTVPIPTLAVLCRTMDQIQATLSSGIREIYADFEDIRRYKEAVEAVRSVNGGQIFLATPRIQKAGEQGFFKLIEKMEPDGVLIRNLGAVAHFEKSSMRRIGDFSLNVANPLAAQFFLKRGLDSLTISYDLNIAQILALLHSATPHIRSRLEITLHQHMPMFHMEHCVFAAFLSKGKDHTDCGRPCDSHRVHLRDRVGTEHPLRADVGCRNTLLNAVPQTGAGYYRELLEAGIRRFRVELLEEDSTRTSTILRAYKNLLSGESAGKNLWRELNARSQVGVTSGTLQDD